MDDENSNYPTIRKRIVIVFFFSSPCFSQRKKYFRSKYLVVNREFFFTRNFWDEISLIQIKKKEKKTRDRKERLIFHGGGKSFRQTYSYTSNVSYQYRGWYVHGYSYRILVAVIAACQLEHARFIRKYIYIYIYTNRKSITSSFQETEKEIEGSGRGGVDFSNREISRI